MGFLVISSMMFLGGIYVIFAFTWWILQIVANWRIFTKAGEAGWKSIIPVYGDYISYKIAWQTGYFWLIFVLGIISSWIQNYANPAGDSTLLLMIVSLIRIITGIIGIMYSVKLARAFGRGIGFAIGLIFLQPIFMLILGFGSDRYYGADKQKFCSFRLRPIDAVNRALQILLIITAITKVTYKNELFLAKNNGRPGLVALLLTGSGLFSCNTQILILLLPNM